MYLEIFLADFTVFRVFLGISRDFGEIPEFREISEALFHGADGGGNATFFFLFEGRRTSEKALLIFLPIAQLLLSQVLCSNDH